MRAFTFIFLLRLCYSSGPTIPFDLDEALIDSVDVDMIGRIIPTSDDSHLICGLWINGAVLVKMDSSGIIWSRKMIKTGPNSYLSITAV